jgi:hypothetical protein
VYLSNGFNVVIDPTGGSFDYPGAPWASIDDIPLFYVVVKGANIYIDSSASKIAGVYIAEPSSSGVGGNIYTCSDGDTIYAPSQLFTTGSGSTGGCAQQLTVDGALIGNNIRFWRTNSSNSGSANAAPADTNTTNCTLATNNASETVCYNPLNWLANPFSPGSDDYNEITGLPPTL